MKTLRRTLALAAGWLAAVLSMAAPAMADQPAFFAEPRQKLVGGTLVDLATRRALGLVTVGNLGGCSGTLLNRYWVLTAEHCLAATAAETRVSTAWAPGEEHFGTRVVRYQASHGLDVALIYLGATNFGPVPTQPIATTAPTADDRVEAFGAGIFRFAVAPNTPSQNDGRFRSALFDITSVTDTGIVLPGGTRAIAGGDSGGPDWLISGTAFRTAIVAVHSRARTAGCVAGKSCAPPNVWRWTTGVLSSTSDRVDIIAANIRTRIRDYPCRLRRAACNTPAVANLVIMK